MVKGLMQTRLLIQQTADGYTFQYADHAVWAWVVDGDWGSFGPLPTDIQRHATGNMPYAIACAVAWLGARIFSDPIFWETTARRN